MELQIEDLVSSIKKDGVDAANAQAQKIIDDAKRKAEDMINSAKAEQEKLKAQAENEINILKESARVGAMQAQRDAVLLFKDAVKAEFEKLLEADIKKTVSTECLATLIKASVNEENPADYVAEIGAVYEGLAGELAKEIKEGLEIKISSSIKTGFRLSAKDGSGYFDCSDEEIAEMLAPYLPEINI